MNFLPKEKFKDAISALMKEYKVVAPVRENGRTLYKEITAKNIDLIDLEHRPLNAPKQYLYPDEVIFKYAVKGANVNVEEIIGNEKILLLGLRPCDMKSIEFLDKVFSLDCEDPYYTSRRKNTILGSLNCPSEQDLCFCTDVGVKEFAENFDIAMIPTDKKIFIQAGSENGDKVIKKIGHLLSAETFDFLKFCGKIIEKIAHLPHRVEYSLDDDLEKVRPKRKKPRFKHPLKELVEKISDEEWRKIGSGCLQCGACAFVCPECYCFTFVDKKSGKDKGGKIRLGASCMMENFTQLALGANSRKEGFERAKQRYKHKFVYLPDAVGMFGCVGCGRCLEVCPAGIDLFKHIK